MVTWDIARGGHNAACALPSPQRATKSCTCQWLLVPDWGTTPFGACQPSLTKAPELREMVDFVKHLGSRQACPGGYTDIHPGLGLALQA